MSFTREKTLVGRKDHYCIWCNLKINKGMKHFYSCGVYDYEFSDYRIHLGCKSKLDFAISKEDEPQCIDDLIEAFNEYYKEEYNKEARR